MPISTNIIVANLICLASKNHQNTLVDLIKQTGETLSIIDSVCWLKNLVQDFNAPIVLVLPEDNRRGDQIVKAILAKPLSYYLIVVPTPITDDISPILAICDDWCQWPCDPAEFSMRLRRLLSKYSSSIELAPPSLQSAAWKSLNLIGHSAIFRDTLTLITKAANCDAPVLIEGETGCGKEVAARAIHYLGARKDFPFIPMNCGAIPDQLIENELFGHEKGAYTDAKHSQAGLTQQAHCGTLFLDEIEALSIKGQVALLRFIEDHVVKPLGGTKSRKVDVRIIAASNMCLSELVQQGLFRQDLLFRLNLLQLNLPPLRRRKTDIPSLAEHFMQKYRIQYQQPNKRLHPGALAWMADYQWPGNVRELENVIHRSFLLSQDSEISHTDIPHNTQPPDSRRKLVDRRQHVTFDVSFNEAKNQVIDHFEQRYLMWLLSNTQGNVTQAAEKAKKERSALRKLLKKHAINPNQFRKEPDQFHKETDVYSSKAVLKY